VVSVVEGVQVCLELKGAIDVSAETARITKDRQKTDKERAQIAGRLANTSFVERAPAAVVEKERERLAELDEKMAKIDQSLARLSRLS
jgi:valyl-tRNA synthetase